VGFNRSTLPFVSPTEYTQCQPSDLFDSRNDKLNLYKAICSFVLRHTWPAVFLIFQLQRRNVTPTGYTHRQAFRVSGFSIFQVIRYMNVGRPVLGFGRLYPQEISLELISIRGRVDSSDIVWPEGLSQCKV
jgi:hypothetical protein